jgi:hypothetical protein
LPTETQTLEPPVTPTVTIPPTLVWTPLPTLEPDKAKIKVLDLLNYNAGCRLPCWWGITPGETSEVNAIQFLSSFTDLETSWGSPGREQSAPVEPGSIIGNLGSSYQVFGNYGNIEYTFRDGLVDTISAYHGGGTGDRRVDTYQLSRLLADYGKPDDLGIFADPTGPNGATLDLSLFYHLGIYIHYLYFNVDFAGSNMRVCPQGIGPEELQLWSPRTSQFTFADFFSIPIILPTFKAATGIDMDTFYRLFKSPENRACLETPVNLWTSKSVATP